jgi:hypothetical protein
MSQRITKQEVHAVFDLWLTAVQGHASKWGESDYVGSFELYSQSPGGSGTRWAIHEVRNEGGGISEVLTALGAREFVACMRAGIEMAYRVRATSNPYRSWGASAIG